MQRDEVLHDRVGLASLSMVAARDDETSCRLGQSRLYASRRAALHIIGWPRDSRRC